MEQAKIGSLKDDLKGTAENQTELQEKIAALEVELEQAKIDRKYLKKVTKKYRTELQEKYVVLEAQLEQAESGQDDLKEMFENREELQKQIAALEAELGMDFFIYGRKCYI